jgi:glycosyltransferase involved in cell wall biosynthesis
LKVLWISHLVPWPPTGGVLQRSFNLLREAARRHSVFLVALNQRAILPTKHDVAAAVAELAGICESVRVCDIPANRSRVLWAAIAAVSVVTRQPYDANWLWSPRMRSVIAELRALHRFDLVHLDTVGLYQYAAVFPQTPIVLNHHNVESAMMRSRAGIEDCALRRWYFERQARKLAALERVAATRARVNLVVSDTDAERLQVVAPGCRSHTVTNGVDVRYFRANPNATPAPRSLVFIGGMTWYPNRDAMRFFAQEIWPGLLRVSAEWRATIVGTEPPREVVARPWFDAGAIYLCPIRTGGGTRLKILDALAMAKPLVATGFAVEGLRLVENEHYLRAETAAEFVCQLERLATDSGLRGQLSRNARKLVEERYAWGIVGEALELAYQRAFGGRGIED